MCLGYLEFLLAPYKPNKSSTTEIAFHSALVCDCLVLLTDLNKQLYILALLFTVEAYLLASKLNVVLRSSAECSGRCWEVTDRQRRRVIRGDICASLSVLSLLR